MPKSVLDRSSDVQSWSPHKHTEWGPLLNALFGAFLLCLRKLEELNFISCVDFALLEEMLSAFDNEVGEWLLYLKAGAMGQ